MAVRTAIVHKPEHQKSTLSHHNDTNLSSTPHPLIIMWIWVLLIIRDTGHTRLLQLAQYETNKSALCKIIALWIDESILNWFSIAPNKTNDINALLDNLMINMNNNLIRIIRDIDLKPIPVLLQYYMSLPFNSNYHLNNSIKSSY